MGANQERHDQISSAQPGRPSLSSAIGPRQMAEGHKQGNSGDVHYFEHASGQVAGVKYYPNEASL
jgi:hypothetical protein